MAQVDKWRLHAVHRRKDINIEGNGFDELVVGDWFHMEKMDKNIWWMRVGDARVGIRLKKGGNPEVTIDRGEY